MKRRMPCTSTGSSGKCTSSKSEGHTLMTNSIDDQHMIVAYTVGSSDECSLYASLETHLLTNTSGFAISSDAHHALDHPSTSESSRRRWSPSSGHSPDRPTGSYSPRRIIRRMLDFAAFFHSAT